MFVPQQEAWVVERMGKFNRILEPGLNILMPIIDRVKYVQSLKEIAIDVPQQSAITSDNVTLSIDGVLYLRILDPYLGNSTSPTLFDRIYSHDVKCISIMRIIRHNIFNFSFVWCWRSRIRNNTIGPDNDEIWIGQNGAR